VLYNSMGEWTELMMLPEAVLCLPQGPSKANETTAAFTLDRLERWEAGERLTLWADATQPQTRSEGQKANTEEARCLRA
jgi:hypothetical protein